MNDLIVGMENLPNIFIDKIILDIIDINGTDVYNISVRTAMFDHRQNPSWKGRNLGIKTKIVFATGNVISLLNEGMASLYDYKGFGVIINSCEDYVVIEHMGDYSKYSNISSFVLPKFPNLNVYAACFIDGLEFGNDLFDKFYGPMVGEKIFVGGEINVDTGYFYDPETNEEYGGPVHSGPNGFMVGSEHKTEDHPNIRYVQETNTKIINYQFDSSSDVYSGNDIDGRQITTTIGTLRERIDQVRPMTLGEQAVSNVYAGDKLTNNLYDFRGNANRSSTVYIEDAGLKGAALDLRQFQIPGNTYDLNNINNLGPPSPGQPLEIPL